MPLFGGQSKNQWPRTTVSWNLWNKSSVYISTCLYLSDFIQLHSVFKQLDSFFSDCCLDYSSICFAILKYILQFKFKNK